ncbi:outer membrane beta-barrel protein [Winogradskyella psychrotolerans]|uniref:outer membrane beta-barrel protein n=1 Tax=Winogradskyella psychrotolerans TaxID=1344585 RepID=UPI001C065E55|nr:outer membrane beta-barrel protein [Winogradskyella psychrotolerans]MBU2927237.1 PorT family protein [Winogradskyella psychrotolerans]
MKNFIRIALILVTISGSFNVQAQADFGLKGGVNLTFFNVEEANFGESSDVQLGFYAGCFADFEIENDFHLQPELLYIRLGDFKFLNAPVYLKYHINTNFNILVGPSINYFFDFNTAKLKVRADLAFAYNLTSDLDVHMKYTIGFEEITPNGLFLGVGYKL